RLNDGAAVGGRRSRGAVLKRRLYEIKHVVDDDVAAGGAQSADVVREAPDAVESRGEVQLRARGEVVDDLEDRRAFVAGARLARQHYHRTEIVARLARREIRDAVREDADLHAGSINVKRAAGGE